MLLLLVLSNPSIRNILTRVVGGDDIWLECPLECPCRFYGNHCHGDWLLGTFCSTEGEGTVPNASRRFVSSDSAINANALQNGDGGRVIVWADRATRFYGTIKLIYITLLAKGAQVRCAGGKRGSLLSELSNIRLNLLSKYYGIKKASEDVYAKVLEKSANNGSF